MAELEPRDEARVRSALRPFFELSRREQLRMFELIGDYLAVPIERETAGQRITRVRALAQAQMRVVAEHHGRPPGRAPTRRQYEEAVGPLRLKVSFSQLLTVYETWQNACEVYEQRWHHESAAQYAQRAGGQYGRGAATMSVSAKHVEGIRRWLAGSPPMLSRAAYTDFARRHNEAETRAGRTPEHPDRVHLVNGKQIESFWGIRFSDFIEFVQGRITIDEARERRLDQVLHGDADLMSVSHVRVLLGLTKGQLETKLARGEVPPPVKFSTRVAWLREDIEVIHADGVPPRRDLEATRARYLDSSETAALIRMPRDQFSYWLVEHRWDRVPEPAGALARFYYWRRVDVLAWEPGRVS